MSKTTEKRLTVLVWIGKGEERREKNLHFKKAGNPVLNEIFQQSAPS